MADIKPTGHGLYDALLNQEFLVRKETPKLDLDKTISATTIKTVVLDARGCLKTTCLWAHVVKAGGTPCNKCRHLVLGDYFKT